METTDVLFQTTQQRNHWAFNFELVLPRNGRAPSYRPGNKRERRFWNIIGRNSYTYYKHLVIFNTKETKRNKRPFKVKCFASEVISCDMAKLIISIWISKISFSCQMGQFMPLEFPPAKFLSLRSCHS